MLKKSLTSLLLMIATPIYAEDSSSSLLDDLDVLAKFNATDVLSKSIKDYYASDAGLSNGKYPSLLHDAAIFGEVNLLKYLIKNDPHGIEYAYKDGPTPLGYIAGDNQLESAKLLLQAGADPNNPGNTDVFPLAAAVNSGNMEMIRLLLKYKATIHIGAYFQSPLNLVLERNDIEILELFDQQDNFILDSMDNELRIMVTEYLNSDLVEESVLRILKNHGFDIYAKTEEKPSFIEEYGKKIEYSDVKQLLLDIYGSNSSINSEEINSLPVIEEADSADASQKADCEAKTVVADSSKNIDAESQSLQTNKDCNTAEQASSNQSDNKESLTINNNNGLDNKTNIKENATSNDNELNGNSNSSQEGLNQETGTTSNTQGSGLP